MFFFEALLKRTPLAPHEILLEARGKLESMHMVQALPKRHRVWPVYRKVIIPGHLPDDAPLVPLAKKIIDLNAALCTQVYRAQRDLRATSPPPPSERWLGGYWRPMEKAIRDQDFFILQPPFRALAVALISNDYSIPVVDITKVPVLLVLTGFDTFVSDKAARVSLGVAIDFVLSLEKREVAAFGPKPGPVQSTKDLEDGCSFGLMGFPRHMRRLGWGDEPLYGPSSSWVDQEKYPEWRGDGAVDDKHCFHPREERQ
ncbi:hypothetical protein ACJZ2D_005517 [Fusarium nematophilum]